MRKYNGVLRANEAMGKWIWVQDEDRREAKGVATTCEPWEAKVWTGGLWVSWRLHFMKLLDSLDNIRYKQYLGWREQAVNPSRGNSVTGLISGIAYRTPWVLHNCLVFYTAPCTMLDILLYHNSPFFAVFPMSLRMAGLARKLCWSCSSSVSRWRRSRRWAKHGGCIH